MPINWTGILQEQGFSDVPTMLRDLYFELGQNVVALSLHLKVSEPTVRKYLLANEIIKKSDKNGFHLGMFTCRWCKKQFEGDRRQVCCTDPRCLAKEKVYKKDRIAYMKTQRPKKDKGSVCRICGQPKGVNRFFCNHCLQYVDAGSIAGGF